MVEAGKLRVIAGFGRSGTTWLQDVIAEANGMRTVFEPLHPDVVRGAQPFAYRFVPPEVEFPDLHFFLGQYFFDDFHSVWADYRVRWDRLLPAPRDLFSYGKLRRLMSRGRSAVDQYSRFRGQRRFSGRIVKFIRANMMLAWLKARFDARIVFVIRHPVPVILSQLREPNVWNPHHLLARYRSDDLLLAHLDVRLKNLLFESLDDIEAHALSWCIENSCALEQARDSGILVVYYEDVLRNGMQEWQKIIDALELDNLPLDAVIARPSQQAWGKRADAGVVSQYDYWLDSADRSLLEKTQRILDVAGINAYRSDTAVPVIFKSAKG